MSALLFQSTNLLVAAVALFLLIANVSVYAYIVRLDPGESRCFFVDLADDHSQNINVQFGEHFEGQPPKGGQPGDAIVALLRGPKGNVVRSDIPEGSFRIVPEESGKHYYCFRNQTSNRPVEAMFQITGTELAGDSGKVKNAGKGQLDNLLRELASNLRQISNTQDFIEKHVRKHASIAHSSKGLVVLWHIIQIGLVGGVIYAQTTFIKRIFEKPIKAV